MASGKQCRGSVRPALQGPLPGAAMFCQRVETYSPPIRACSHALSYAQGVKLAEELVRRHLQDHGNIRHLVVDLGLLHYAHSG